MATDPRKNLVDGKYTIRDLVDLKKLHGIFQHFTDTMGFTIGFLSAPDMDILIATGWRDICTKFHRRCPISLENCRKSNARLMRKMNRPGKVVIEACANGLVDCAMPVFIKGKCVAILATGQVLLEPPDLLWFRRQAKVFGCNEKKYMAALAEIPVVSAERLRQVTGFLKELASLVAELGYRGLKEKEKSEELAQDIAERKRSENLLRETASQLQALQGAMRDGLLVAEVQARRILKANPGICRMFGYSEKEFLSKKVSDLHRSQDVKKVFREFRELARGRKTLAENIPCRKKDGAVFFADITARTVIFQGKACLIGCFRDVTERLFAERTARRQGALDSLIARISLSFAESTIGDIDAVVHSALGEVGRFLEVERVFMAFASKDRKEWNMTHEWCAPRIASILPRVQHIRFGVMAWSEKTLLANKSVKVESLRDYPAKAFKEKRFHRLSGVRSALCVPTVGSGGHVCGYVGFHDLVHGRVWSKGEEASLRAIGNMIVNAIERKRAEAQELESSQRLQAVFDSAFQFIALLKSDGTVVEVNPAALSFAGLVMEDVKGRFFWDCLWWTFSTETQRKLRSAIARAAKGKFVRYAVDVVGRKKTRITIDFSLKPVKDERGRVILLTAEGRDISEIKRAEEALGASEKRFRGLFESSQDAMTTLESPSWRFTSSNASMARMFKAKNVNELLSHSPWELSPKRQPDGSASFAKARKMIQIAIRKGSNFFKWSHRRIDGELFPSEVLLTRVERKGGMFLQATIRDVTERTRAEEKIRADEERLRLLYSTMNEGLALHEIVRDKNGLPVNYRILETNEAYEKHTGVKMSRAHGKLATVVYKTKEAPFLKIFSKVALKGKPVAFESYFPPMKRYFSISVFSPRYGQFATIFTDITDRKQAEEKMRESNELLSLFMRHSPIFTYIKKVTPTEDRVLQASDNFHRMFGIASKKVVGKTMEELFPKEFAAKIIADDRAVIAGGKTVRFEEHFKGRTYASIKFPIIMGKTTLLAGYTIDITERKLAEDNLRSSEARFRSYFELPLHGIAITSPEKGWVQVNDRVCSLLGYSRKELVSKTWSEMTHPDDLAADVKQFDRVLSGEIDQYSLDKRFIRKDGRAVWTSLGVGCVRKPDGTVDYVCALLEDITDRKEMELALEKRILTLTQPVGAGDSKGIEFEDLFNLDEIQMIQDEFTKATGVASIITRVDGTPITRPSNFCRLCQDIVRKTEKGLANCYQSDACIGRPNPEGPIVQPCLSGGLWDAGASITVGGRHVANWLIGQVRDETQTEEKIRAYAREIGADEEEAAKAFREVIPMPRAQFDKVAQLLFTMAKQLSQFAYQNLQQARAITESKRAEALINASRHQLFQVIDTVPHMIFAKDRKGRFLLANRAVGDMYGTEPKELIGLRRQDIHMEREEAEQFLKGDQEVLTTGKPILVSNEHCTDVRGRKHILQTIKIPFEMVGMREKCILGVSVDVTEQRKVEEFRNDIIRTVSHELRTPLSIEKEGISLLLDGMVGPLSGEQRELLETVMRSIDRLSRMITSLLDISTIETGKIHLSHRMTDLGDLVKDVFFEFKKRANSKGIDLKVKLPGRVAPVLADPDKIAQVLSNLVDNAIKFTPEKGAVEISVAVVQDAVECEIRDNGMGIAAENVGKLFEKFQQFSRTAGPGEKGFGLGLSIAKGIVELHGGRIWAKSELGKGTQVTFMLPIFQKEEV